MAEWEAEELEVEELEVEELEVEESEVEEMVVDESEVEEMVVEDMDVVEVVEQLLSELPHYRFLSMKNLLIGVVMFLLLKNDLRQGCCKSSM